MYLLYKLKSKLLPISNYSNSIIAVFDSAGAVQTRFECAIQFVQVADSTFASNA